MNEVTKVEPAVEMIGGVEMSVLNPPEKRRTYHHLPSGRSFHVADVTHFANRPSSGTHRLRTHDGRLWIVHPEQGWVVEIDTTGWTK